ncbi:uncharacterized protein LOC103701897 [Phoenix dactylifera]|uniref:Uncharacterized protein LOC103701897 n=1 Tax=Phoenix dactylifera TaxID=42345 RepID=A0A8B7BNW0_PHODC|nr:uncharacterized protein LOC103701897 [Phoenix dactylifera]
MEVAIPMAPAQDFRFQSASASPYASAPSSPKPFGHPSDYSFHYASAPASPSRTAAIYAHVFGWEDKSGRPKPSVDDEEEFDFAFGFDRQLQRKAPTTNLAAADELFEKGRIRPLKPPPHLHHPAKDDGSSTASSSSRGGGGGYKPPSQEVVEEGVKDRGRTPSTRSTTCSSRSRRGPRSLSPIRGAGDFRNFVTSSTTPTPTSSTKGGGSKRWRLKDLLLFRSASEGCATERGSKDAPRKHSMFSLPPFLSNRRRSGGEHAKNSGSKPTDKNGSIRRGSGPAVSAHEKHYTMNRAASEDLKKKTPLPFHRPGLFGCSSFDPAIDSITRGVSSNSSRGRT